MPSLPLVQEYMDTEVPTLTPDIGIADAVDFLINQRVTGAPVIDSNGDLVGIVTEKDCLKLLAMGDASSDVPKGTVAEFMSTDLRTVPPRMNVYFAAGMFLNDHVRRFPVVEDGKLVGAITRFDILRAIQKALR